VRALLVTAALLVLVLLAWWVGGRGGQDRRSAAQRSAPEAPAGTREVAASDKSEPAEPAAEALPATEAGEERSIRVVDEKHAPVQGAWIEVRRSEREVAAARVHADGLGCAVLRIAREDELFAGAPGFMLTRVKKSALRRGSEEVVLRRSYRIAGVVVDGAGAGVPGAELRLREPFLPERTATSGPDGRFVFEDVCDREMLLGAEAAGYSGNGLTVPPGDADVRVVLSRPRSVSGIVVLPDGLPAAGATVNQLRVGTEGRFTLGGLIPGVVELWAVLETADRTWASNVSIELAADGAHPPVQIVLEPRPRSWVRVRVLERDGSPASVGVRDPQSVVPSPRTDASGAVTLAYDHAPGTRTHVRVEEKRSDGLLPGRADVVTGARDGPEVVLRPREPLLLTIVARGPAGEALPTDVSARFETYALKVLGRRRDSVTVAFDPQDYEFDVTVSAPGFVQHSVRLPPPPDGYLEIRLQATGSISCRLVDEAGVPVLHGHVEARGRRAGSQGTHETGPDGVYRLDGAPAGRVVVSAGFDDDVPLVRLEADVRAGGTTDLGTLVLKAPRALSGRVTDASGRPIGGATWTAVGDDFEARGFSRSDGSFRVVVPSWFQGRVMTEKPGYGTVHRPMADALELRMPVEGKVRLEVRFPSRSPGGWSFAVRDPTTGFRWRVHGQNIEGTTYIVRGLPPGRLVLIVETLLKAGETEVVVVAGETVPAVVQVPE